MSGADKVNTLGFCIGGTLLASAATVMRSEDTVASMTLLTTMLDYADTGEIGALVTEQSITAREAAIGGGGLMQGKELAFTFSSLRANDLVWQCVVNSYLKGKAPPAFDLLFWNADSTNFPGPMFCWYVRNTYLENNLRVPGRTIQCGEAVTLSLLTHLPFFMHRAKTTSCRGARLMHRLSCSRRHDLCARRQRSYCGRDQSRIEEQAQSLVAGRPDRSRSLARDPRERCRGVGGRSGAIGLGSMQAPKCRHPARRAASNTHASRRPRTLREGKGLRNGIIDLPAYLLKCWRISLRYSTQTASNLFTRCSVASPMRIPWATAALRRSRCPPYP